MKKKQCAGIVNSRGMKALCVCVYVCVLCVCVCEGGAGVKEVLNKKVRAKDKS